jgi:hypothetical protein
MEARYKRTIVQVFCNAVALLALSVSSGFNQSDYKSDRENNRANNGQRPNNNPEEKPKLEAKTGFLGCATPRRGE